jgi:hypothetical protein
MDKPSRYLLQGIQRQVFSQIEQAIGRAGNRLQTLLEFERSDSEKIKL